MVRDLRSIAATVRGELLEGTLPADAPVDEAMRLDEFTVVGNPAFATLVVAGQAELLRALRTPARASALARAAVVSADDSPRLRAALARAGATAVLAADTPADALHPRLVALLAIDQAAEDRRVTTGTKVLTQVARRGGVRAVVAELAHRLDGWAVLVDPHGRVITTAGAGGLHVQDAVAVAFNRPVRVRHPGLQVHPVGPGEDLTAYLVIASREGSRSRSRDLASQAAALLDLVLRTHDHTATERLGREVMIGTLLAGGPAATELLRRWSVLDSTLTAFALTARSRSVDLERLVLRWLDELGSVHVVTQEGGHLLGFLRDDHADEFARLVELVTPEMRAPLRLGLGSSAPVDALARSAEEARQALEVAVTDARPVVRYRALPTVSYVLDRLADGDAARIASVLDPLRGANGRHDDLARTLRVYLAEHGTWGVAAERLGIHRQTLASRIRRVEDLTGLSMGDPDDRVAAWLALRALDR